MYMMVRIHPEAFVGIPDDKEFAQLLLKVLSGARGARSSATRHCTHPALTHFCRSARRNSPARQEEAVFVLPGSCFGAPNFFRIVFTAPEAKLREAYDRIIEFCERHAAPSS